MGEGLVGYALLAALETGLDDLVGLHAQARGNEDAQGMAYGPRVVGIAAGGRTAGGIVGALGLALGPRAVGAGVGVLVDAGGAAPQHA